jgi:pimeloyl-ACP methyl ester carboxylesterase
MPLILNYLVIIIFGFPTCQVLAQARFKIINEYAGLLANLITEKSTTSKIFLVAHSFGSVIATLICENLNEKVTGFISVEGNLTQADSYFSGWAGQYEDGEVFQQDFKKLLKYKSDERPEFEYYFASATIADPKALILLGKSSRNFTKNEDAGNRFLALQCPKLYIWGDVDTPAITRDFIINKSINNYLFKGHTHWMMKEDPDLFYSKLIDFFNQT